MIPNFEIVVCFSLSVLFVLFFLSTGQSMLCLRTRGNHVLRNEGSRKDNKKIHYDSSSFTHKILRSEPEQCVYMGQMV